jgi:hypothetical protein
MAGRSGPKNSGCVRNKTSTPATNTTMIVSHTKNCFRSMDMRPPYPHQRIRSARRLGVIQVANFRNHIAILKIHEGRGAPRSWIQTPTRKIPNPIRMVALAM